MARIRLASTTLLLLPMLFACGSGGAGTADAQPSVIDAQPTLDAQPGISYEARLLDFSALGDHDDDPAILLGADGSYYLVFLSDRSGQSELWLTRSTDTKIWDTPRALTNDSSGDIYPSLVQSADETIHLVWAKQLDVSPFTSHIFHAAFVASGDASILTEVVAPTQITSGLVDDTFPSLVSLGGNDLRIYLNNATGRSSTSMDVYSMESTCATWCDPELVSSLSTDAHELLPMVMRKADGEFISIHQRQTASTSFLDATAEIFVSASTDGLAWSTPQEITSNGDNSAADVIPNISRLASGYVFSWTSTAYSTGPQGQGGVVLLAEEDIATAATSVVDLLQLKNMQGWSMRTATADPNGNIFQIWVSDLDPAGSNIWGRFVE